MDKDLIDALKKAPPAQREELLEAARVSVQTIVDLCAEGGVIVTIFGGKACARFHPEVQL